MGVTEEDPVRLDHFRILAGIGRGGMGIVYRAEDEKLQRVVALKVLPPGFEKERDRRARFLREARAAAAVTHPNIATVYEIGEADGRVFIAMELVEGRTLRAMLGEGPLRIPDAVRIATQVARGLAKAHQAHVVHRDLKPDNIMVGEDLHTKILDFGLAKMTASTTGTQTPSALERVETETREGMLLGTPQYMSPEQAKGRPLDATSDVFSFGVVLYEMVTGRRPFDGPSVAEIIIAIDRDAPAPLSVINPQVPAALASIIDRCLEKDPARRYPDGRAIADALAALAVDTPPPRTPPPPAPVVYREVATAPLPLPSVQTPGPTQLAVRPPRKRRLVQLVGLGVLALFAVRRCSEGTGGKGGSAALPKQAKQAVSAIAAAAQALQDGEAMLGCPPLVATGVQAPGGWLGAAAADIVCRRAAIAAGGRLDRVLVPAQLLDLPRQPSDDFPRDPYGAADARDRAIASAKARAKTWLDGSVDKQQDGFHVKLVLRDEDGDEDEHGEGTGRHVYMAIREAMRPILKGDAIDKEDQIDPEVAQWSGIKDVDLALAYDDWHDSLGTSPVATAAELATLAAHKKELGALWPQIQFESQLPMLTVASSFDPVSLDRSSPAAFAISAVSYAETVPTADHAALAAETGKLRDTESSRVGRGALLLAQAYILVSGGQTSQAGELALGELKEEPRSDHTWEIPLLAQEGQDGFGRLARAFAAWLPEDHVAWNAIATGDRTLKDAAERLPFSRRAYEISPEFPMWADTFGKQLVQAGRPEEARSVATAMLATGSFMATAAQSVLVLVDAGEAHFGAGVQRGLQAIDARDRFGTQVGDWYLIDAVVAAGAVVQNGAAIGDDFARRFVLGEPLRLDRGDFIGGPLILSAADACMLASRDVSKRCFVRLRQLLAARYFPAAEPTAGAYLDGCDHYAQGDLRGASTAWRPLVSGHAADSGFAGNAIARFGPIAFDAAGEHDLAVKLDQQSLATGFDTFGGASPAHAREARRALAKGDKDRARELAQKIIDAWGAADVQVPAVADMRSLLSQTK